MGALTFQRRLKYCNNFIALAIAGIGSSCTTSEASVKAALKFLIKVALDGLLLDCSCCFFYLGPGNRGGATGE